MRPGSAWILAGLLACCTGAGAAQEAPGEEPPKQEKKEKGGLRAQRAGWMLGMYVGEGNGPYPFVLEVADRADAKLKGIRHGDELIRFEEVEATPLSRVFDRAKKLRPGREVTLWVRRGVQTIQFQVRVPESPDASTEKTGAGKSERKGDRTADGEKKKKGKRKSPVVIKPIPVPDR